MRTKIFIAVLAGVLLVGGNLYAGDLVVSGNLGVGNAAPLYKLSLEGTDIYLETRSTTTHTGIVLRNSILATEYNAGIYLTGDQLDFERGGNPRLTIRGNGNIGIGTVNPSALLHVNGIIYSAGGYSGSDVKWKKDISPVEHALSSVLKLQGVTYSWRADEYKDKNFDGGKQIGLIAQDVEKVIPELVRTDNEGYKAVSYEKLTAVLVEALKDQEKKITELESRLKSLEGNK